MACGMGGYPDPEAIFLSHPYCDLDKEVYNFQSTFQRQSQAAGSVRSCFDGLRHGKC